MRNAKLIWPPQFKFRGVLFDESWIFGKCPEDGDGIVKRKDIDWFEATNYNKEKYYCFGGEGSIHQYIELTEGREFRKHFEGKTA